MNVLAQTTTLSFFSHLRPEIIDALKPHISVPSERVRNIHASGIIKYIAKNLGDTEVAKELYNNGKILFHPLQHI